MPCGQFEFQSQSPSFSPSATHPAAAQPPAPPGPRGQRSCCRILTQNVYSHEYRRNSVQSSKRRSLAITNNTPVTIVDDPAFQQTPSPGSTGSGSPNDPVLVKITNGVDQGTEVLVRRQDITRPIEPSENLAVFLPIAFLLLIGAAATLWSVETLALTLKNRREGKRDGITMHPSARVGFSKSTPKQRTRMPDRGDRESDHWLATVAALTARRKVRCTNSCRRSAATAH